ncbi:MAG: endonuclease/exonuclease/phosphatase family protein [Myxococcaceae bacterium]
MSAPALPRLALVLLALLAGLGCDSRGPRPDAGQPAPADAGVVEVPPGPRIRVATFNVRRFFDSVCQSGLCAPGDYEELPSPSAFEARADQLATGIRALEAQVVVLQEVETQACLDALAARLSDVLPSAVLGETGATASVDVAVLSSAPIGQVVRHRGLVLTRPDGSTTSFAREFLEVHLTVGGRAVVVFAAHFRSKVNDDAGRRLAEAGAAHDLVAGVAAASPGALVVLGGDLNDFPGSPPIDALASDGKLLRVAGDLPMGEQATYAFNGTGQAIDHLFQATAAAGRYRPGSARAVRGSPGYAGSDHAALYADFDPPP